MRKRWARVARTPGPIRGELLIRRRRPGRRPGRLRPTGYGGCGRHPAGPPPGGAAVRSAKARPRDRLRPPGAGRRPPAPALSAVTAGTAGGAFGDVRREFARALFAAAGALLDEGAAGALVGEGRPASASRSDSSIRRASQTAARTSDEASLRPRSSSDRYGMETRAARATSARVRPCSRRARRRIWPRVVRSSGFGRAWLWPGPISTGSRIAVPPGGMRRPQAGSVRSRYLPAAAGRSAFAGGESSRPSPRHRSPTPVSPRWARRQAARDVTSPGCQGSRDGKI